jgi:outer membrane protein assembly factor BamB
VQRILSYTVALLASIGLTITLLTVTLLTVTPLNGRRLLASSPISSEQETTQTNQRNNSEDEPNETSWSMAGANPQRTSWVPDEVDPGKSPNFGIEWYRPIEAYIGQHVQLVTARNKVFISTARGLYALDTASGNEVWRFDTEMPLGHSPTVVGNRLYVAGFDRRVYALNADTGMLHWIFEEAKGGFSTNPLVVEGKVLLGSREGYFYALDQNSGSLLWQYPPAGQAPLAPILYSAAYADGKVFFAANDNYAYALNISTGSLEWQSAKMPGDGYQAWWPVVYGGYVIFSAAQPYSEADPGAASVSQVVATDSEYYRQMQNFQYGLDPTNVLQRDDIFHQNEPDKAPVGPTFLSGSVDDSTAISWSWVNGTPVLDGSKITEYLEDDGQIAFERPTNKPWRRSVIALSTTDGTEFTFDSDGDGHPEYAPFAYVGTKSGNRYPPLVLPTPNSTGALSDVLYAQNLYEHSTGWGIPRAKLMAWQFGTPYLHPVGDNYAIDEPFANSSGGSILYSNLCCDRTGSWYNLVSGATGELWGYNRTLETVALDPATVEPWRMSLAPDYDVMWRDASMYDAFARLWGSYGSTNGIYHNHGLQNPIVPYNGRLFVHRSNAVIAFGPNSVPLRQRRAGETIESYESSIREEYPQVSKPVLPVGEPNNLQPTVTLQDVQSRLDDQISRMLTTGHLRPGYYNSFRQFNDLTNYFENPGDTLYTLVQAYPYVSDSLKPELDIYIKQHYQMFFGNTLYARTGYWLDPMSEVGQLQAREWMEVPPEILQDMKQHPPSESAGNWPWQYPQHNFYALWKFGETFYRDQPAKLQEIYGLAKSRIITSPPEETILVDKPWVHNAFIAGYIGFLELQELAGTSETDADLRVQVQAELDALLQLRSELFAKDHPWLERDLNRRVLSIARNFMYLTPELGDYLTQNAYEQVNVAIDEYARVAPYWVATRYEASFGELASDNLYTHAAMFQAKAYILKEPLNQLLKYIDMPAFKAGDLFYIQSLVDVLDAAKPEIYIGDLNASQGSEVGVWLSVRHINAKRPVGTVALELTYEPAIVTPGDCVDDLDSGFVLLLCDTSVPGKIRVEALSTTGVSQEFRLARIDFQVIGQPGEIGSFGIQVLEFSDPSGNAIDSHTDNGRIVVEPDPSQSPNLYIPAIMATQVPSPSGPKIGSVSTNLSSFIDEQIPTYEKLELTFDVDTVAANLQLPYDQIPPLGLEPEAGVTVDALFSPDNWQTIYTQPAFFYQEFQDEVKGNKEWFYPTNNLAWKIRFAPNQPGTWQYKIVVQDASGTAETASDSFTVSPSDDKGFIRVSQTDSRYFEFEDGTYFPALGYNMSFDRVGWVNPVLDNRKNFQIMSQNGIELVRIWLSQWSIYGSEWNPWNSPDPALHAQYLPHTGITLDGVAPGSEALMQLTADQSPCMFTGSWKATPAVKRNTNYRIRIRYKTAGITGPRVAGQPFGFVAKTGGWLWDDGAYCHNAGVGTVVTPHQTQDTADWQILKGELNSGDSDFLSNFFLVLDNANSGTAYIDYVWIEEVLDNGEYGPNIVSKPWMSHHLYMEQRNSYAFDKMLELAEEYGIYLRPVVHEKNERIFNQIDYEGNTIPYDRLCFDQDQSNDPAKCWDNQWFYGNGRKMTKVRWLQQAWWRYLQARWGYSTHIHSWELLNEGDPSSILHYTLADEFGKYMHQFKPNNHLVSTSNWHSFPQEQFWANSDYPDVDFADVHQYIPENTPGFADTAQVTYDASVQYGAKQAGGTGKPVMRGETGFVVDGSGPATDKFKNDTNAIWLHNFIWGGINPGGLIESYWYDTTHIYSKSQDGDYNFDYRSHYVSYYNFIKSVPLNNGQYQDAEAIADTPNLRVWGQKDLLNGHAHLWIQNRQRTWKNVVDGVTIPAVTSTVTLSGFQPSTTYAVEWWDTYEVDPTQQVIETEFTESSADGSIILSIDNLETDTAVKITPAAE